MNAQQWTETMCDHPRSQRVPAQITGAPPTHECRVASNHSTTQPNSGFPQTHDAPNAPALSRDDHLGCGHRVLVHLDIKLVLPERPRRLRHHDRLCTHQKVKERVRVRWLTGVSESTQNAPFQASSYTNMKTGVVGR